MMLTNWLFDFPWSVDIFRVPDFPATSYIIASTMRTGSYLLCEGLEATGVAGHPQEILCPERRGDYEGWWELSAGVSFAEFLRAGMEKGTTENGVFGTKIHAHHLPPLAEECGVKGEPWRVLEKLFPTAKYVHLRRRNQRAQAISWYRAKVTNQWWRIEGVEDWDLTGREPIFNAAKIRELELELAAHQKLWDEFFAQHQGEVLEMEYESLAKDYRREVARALALIGQDAGLAKELPEPRMQRQGDDTSDRWHKLMDVHFPR